MESKDHALLKQMCANVIDSAKDKPNNMYLQYAATYASVVRELPEDDDYMLYIQIVYMLSNLQYWRCKVARHTKSVLCTLRDKYRPGKK